MWISGHKMWLNLHRFPNTKANLIYFHVDFLLESNSFQCCTYSTFLYKSMRNFLKMNVIETELSQIFEGSFLTFNSQPLSFWSCFKTNLCRNEHVIILTVRWRKDCSRTRPRGLSLDQTRTKWSFKRPVLPEPGIPGTERQNNTTASSEKQKTIDVVSECEWAAPGVHSRKQLFVLQAFFVRLV